MITAFETLKKHFGSHSAAARALGLDVRHYRRIRETGRMSASTRKLIALLAGECRENSSIEAADNAKARGCLASNE